MPTPTPPRSKCSYSTLFLRSRVRLISAGRAPRCRGVDNWSKIVDSFTSSVDTLVNTAVKELKTFVNAEIFGPNGPTKSFRGECLPTCSDYRPAPAPAPGPAPVTAAI